MPVMTAPSLEPSKPIIREVWAHNLEQEMGLLRKLVDHYPYLAMDTEFPGIVARPIGQFKTSTDYHYQTLRCNVDLLKMIQLGITFADENGNIPPDVCTFQFNFKFSLTEDMYAQDSIDLLEKAGLDFHKHEERGIDVLQFGELIMSSGLVLMPSVKWISFHSGYDFGYLLKILTCKSLPNDEHDFFRLLRVFFPGFYDIKYMLRACHTLKGGLQDVADELGIDRIGLQHQAGSDALLTCRIFFRMRRLYFDDIIDDTQYLGYLHGLGNGIVNLTTTTTTTTTTTITTTTNAMAMSITLNNNNSRPSTAQTSSVNSTITATNTIQSLSNGTTNNGNA